MKKILLTLLVASIFLAVGCSKNKKQYNCENKDSLFGNDIYNNTDFLCENNNIKFPINLQSKTIYPDKQTALTSYSTTKLIYENAEIDGTIVKYSTTFNEDSITETKCDKYIKLLEKNGFICKSE